MAHWASGRKNACAACAGLVRVRRDTNLEAHSRALACATRASGGAPDDAHYLMCLDRGRRHRATRAGVCLPGLVRVDARELSDPDDRGRASVAAGGLSCPLLLGSPDRRTSVSPQVWSGCGSRSRCGHSFSRAAGVYEKRLATAASYSMLPAALESAQRPRG